jgi:hypothetical protein
MFLVSSNKVNQLLTMRYIGSVTKDELAQREAEVRTLLAELAPGFRSLQDLTQLDSMDPACMESIGRTMELFHEHGVSLVIRVIPDPAKDIGFNILTFFHYQKTPRIITCQTLAEAAPHLV